jgi:four helix bundle protein
MARKVTTHHDLVVWQESMKLVSATYSLTKTLPREEVFGLVSQMQRAAVSVPSNISEGAARGSTREFRQFLMIARGSLAELETQVLVAQNLGYVADNSPVLQHIKQVLMLLNALIQTLGSKKQL